jgi:WD40 repeat protein
MRRKLPENPFVGLRAYESHESVLFFGRRDQALELMDRLHENRLVAVVGSSGCGKSSLVRAGLIPDLKAGFLANNNDRWQIAVMKPGDAPLYNLASALTEGAQDPRGSAEVLLRQIRGEGLRAILPHLRGTENESGNILLIVDQFEEIFRSIRGGATAEQIDDATDFVALMLGLAEQSELPVYVVLSMRTDFLGDCDTFKGLPEALNRSQYLVPRLSRQQRREVIEGPINLYGAEIRPELADRVLNDAGERSDQLPVLQHALMLTWREFSKTKDEAVSLTHYTECGGMADAIERHAEQAIEGMNAEEVRLTERIFRALTDADEHGRRIRRPLRLMQLAAASATQPDRVLEVLERFRTDDRSFVILSETETPGDPRVDISHEALFRQWKRLEGWVQSEADSKEQYLRLVQSARLHHLNRERLMTDPALQVALNWRASENPTKEWAGRYGGDFDGAMDYLNASLEKSERDRATRTFRKRAALAGAGLAAALLIGNFWWQAHIAKRAALLSSALSAEDPLVRALAAVEFSDVNFKERGLDSLQRAATAAIPVAVFGQRDAQTPDAVVACAFDRTGNEVLTLSKKGTLRRWRADGKGDPLKVVTIPVPAGDAVVSAAFSRDGAWLAAGFGNGEAWIARTDGTLGSKIARQNNSSITALAFRADVHQILAGYADHSVRLFLLDGTVVRSLGDERTNTGPISNVQFDVSGQHAFTVSMDGMAIEWELTTGKPSAIGCSEHDVPVGFSSDGTAVVCAHAKGGGSLIRTNGKGVPVPLDGPTKTVTIAAFSANGSAMATASIDQSVYVWRLENKGSAGTADSVLSTIGAPTVLSGHAGGIQAIAFSLDGSSVLTASEDGTARLWSTEPREPRVIGRHNETVLSVAFSPDGKSVATSSDNSAKVWALDGTAPLEFDALQKVRSVAFSPDSKKVVLGSETGAFCIWNPTQKKMDFRGDLSELMSVAFSPKDGAYIITGARDGVARVWKSDLPTESKDKTPTPLLSIEPQDPQQGWIYRAEFSPDGERVLTASMDGIVRIWRISLGQADKDGAMSVKGKTVELAHSNRILSAAFNADSSLVATGSADHKVYLWRIVRGETQPWRQFKHGADVWQVEFSADGKSLLTASADRTARIWDIETGQVQVEMVHGAGVRGAAFGPRDNSVVTGGEDGVVRLWRVNARDLIQYLSKATTACLLPAERVRYLGETDARAHEKARMCEAIHERTGQAEASKPLN